MLSVVVLTKNEEKNIGECLKSLLWCDEIVIVDDYSEDKTIDIVSKVCKVHKVFKVVQNHLDGDFSGQRNFGLEKAKGEWVLFVDADERVSTELAKEIKRITDNSKHITGYYIKRQDYFLGKQLKHGETANVKLLRLAKKPSGKWSGKVHEEWKVAGETEELSNSLLHYPHPTISEFLTEINFYSTLRAEELYKKGTKVGFWQIILYPKAKFLQNYIWRDGLLDGMPGLVMVLIMSFHSFLVRGKLYLLWQNHESH